MQRPGQEQRYTPKPMESHPYPCAENRQDINRDTLDTDTTDTTMDTNPILAFYHSLFHSVEGGGGVGFPTRLEGAIDEHRSCREGILLDVKIKPSHTAAAIPLQIGYGKTRDPDPTNRLSAGTPNFLINKK